MFQAAAVTAPVTSWGTALLTSITTAFMMFFSAIPRIIGFIIVVAVGWIVANLIAKGVAALLRAVHFDRVASKTGLNDFLHKAHSHQDASGIIATVAKWFVRLVVLVVAFDSLGLTAVSGVLQQLLLWLPNLIVAMVILALGGLAAKALGDLARGTAAKAGLGNPDLMANIARGVVLAFTAIVALNELHVAQVVVNTLLIGTVAAIALAAGLSFGLAGKDMAGEALEGIRNKAKEQAPKLRQASEAARQEAADRAEAAARVYRESGISDRRQYTERRNVFANDGR